MRPAHRPRSLPIGLRGSRSGSASAVVEFSRLIEWLARVPATACPGRRRLGGSFSLRPACSTLTCPSTGSGPKPAPTPASRPAVSSVSCAREQSNCERRDLHSHGASFAGAHDSSSRLRHPPSPSHPAVKESARGWRRSVAQCQQPARSAYLFPGVRLRGWCAFGGWLSHGAAERRHPPRVFRMGNPARRRPLNTQPPPLIAPAPRNFRSDRKPRPHRDPRDACSRADSLRCGRR